VGRVALKEHSLRGSLSSSILSSSSSILAISSHSDSSSAGTRRKFLQRANPSAVVEGAGPRDGLYEDGFRAGYMTAGHITKRGNSQR
jgi:hypothetical protein